MKKINLTAKRATLSITILVLLIIACQIYGSYQYYISTLYIRIVDNINRYEITNLGNNSTIDINTDYLFQPEESDSPLGFALPIF